MKTDLTNYVHSFTGKEIPGMLAVGFLNRKVPFEKGGSALPIDLIDKLKLLLREKGNFRGNIIRGQEPCCLCSEYYSKDGIKLGISELWIPYGDLIYVTPDFILHYIEEHDFMPPEEFIDALKSLDLEQSFEAEKINEQLIFD